MGGPGLMQDSTCTAEEQRAPGSSAGGAPRKGDVIALCGFSQVQPQHDRIARPLHRNWRLGALWRGRVHSSQPCWASQLGSPGRAWGHHSHQARGSPISKQLNICPNLRIALKKRLNGHRDAAREGQRGARVNEGDPAPPVHLTAWRCRFQRAMDTPAALEAPRSLAKPVTMCLHPRQSVEETPIETG